MTLKLPLITGSQTSYPGRGPCPVCRTSKASEPHSFVAVETGALLMNRRTNVGGPSLSLEGFFSVIWHGAHDGGSGRYPDTSVILPIADSVVGGQSTIYFCSPKCFKLFFNTVARTLEAEVRAAARRQRQEASAEKRTGPPNPALQRTRFARR